MVKATNKTREIDIPKAKNWMESAMTQVHGEKKENDGKNVTKRYSNSINQLVDFLVSSSLTFDNFQALHFNGISRIEWMRVCTDDGWEEWK